MAVDVLAEIHGQEFSARRAIRYHEYRIRFWLTLLRASEILEFLLGASAFVSLLAKIPSLAMTLTFVSTLLAGLVICFQASTRVKDNITQRNRFYDHLRLFPSDESLRTSDLLDRIIASRNNIQKDDGVLFPCLSVRCHNDECQAMGRLDECHKMTWFQKHIGSILPISYEEHTNESLTPGAGGSSRATTKSRDTGRPSCTPTRKIPSDDNLEAIRLVCRKLSNGNILLQTGRVMTSEQYAKVRRKVGAYAR